MTESLLLGALLNGAYIGFYIRKYSIILSSPILFDFMDENYMCIDSAGTCMYRFHLKLFLVSFLIYISIIFIEILFNL